MSGHSPDPSLPYEHRAVGAGAHRSLRSPSPCWVVTDGRAGIENQALGLAEAVSRLIPLSITVKRVHLARPLNWLPTAFAPASLARTARGSDVLDVPTPELWIGCGRQAALFSIAARRRATPPFVVQLQNPRAPLDRFDLVLPPAHDGVSGPNVVPLIGSPNRITEAGVAAAASRLSARVLPRAGGRTVIGFVIGGPNRVFPFDRQDADRLASAIRDVSDSGAYPIITLSRRSPPWLTDVVRKAAPADAVIYAPSSEPGLCNAGPSEKEASGKEASGKDVLGEEAGELTADENPYPGLLGLASSVVITNDSVNMIGEALTAGARVLAFPLKPSRQGPNKFTAFLDSLIQRDLVRFYSKEDIGEWRPDRLDETARAAREIVERLRARQ
ncbi:MAG: mitochondrial fission ELM1 family protein [Pseudomonadota bacterium]